MEHDVAYYSVSPFLEEEKDRFVLYCCEKNGKAKEYILCPRPSCIFGYKPGKSAYLIYESGHIPDKINTEYMTTDDAMDIITQNINNLPEIRRRLGRDGVELAEKIRKEAVDILRKKEDVPKHIVVNDISIGKQTRQMIWDLDSKSILDVVKLRRRSDGDYTLEMYLKKLKTIALRDKELVCINDITGIEIYVISKNEVLKKFESFGFINVYDKNGVDSSIISHIKSGYANIIKAIGRKRISSCKELDYSFPFL